MAIGIDRAVHRKLIDCLLELASDLENGEGWRTIKEELERTYDYAQVMLNQAEVCAEEYNQVQALVRSYVAAEQRKRKKILKQTSAFKNDELSNERKRLTA